MSNFASAATTFEGETVEKIDPVLQTAKMMIAGSMIRKQKLTKAKVKDYVSKAIPGMNNVEEMKVVQALWVCVVALARDGWHNGDECKTYRQLVVRSK